jgi:hypothetical protein
MGSLTRLAPGSAASCRWIRPSAKLRPFGRVARCSLPDVTSPSPCRPRTRPLPLNSASDELPKTSLRSHWSGTGDGANSGSALPTHSDSAVPWWQGLLASGWAEAAGLLGFPLGGLGLSVAVLVEALGEQSGVTGWSIGAAAVATTLVWVLGVRQRTPRTVASDAECSRVLPAAEEAQARA